MYFSHVLAAVCPRWHLHALERVSVSFGLDWSRLPHRYSSRSQWNCSALLSWDRSQAPSCDCFTLTCFLCIYARGNERFSWFLLNFIALAILFPSQLCVSSPALTAVAVWGPISASVRLITAAHSAFCVSNQTTNTSGISYTPSAV